MTNSPFKFLDSYTKEDKDIFFGRESEIEKLYSLVFESKTLLVYGVSGTGKSSLIHCGLANKFNEADWLPINIRRGSDMMESFWMALEKTALTPLKKPEKLTAAKFKKAIQSIYLDHFKPVFFIFDQFEELFVFGSDEEQKEFLSIVKSVTESDLQTRFVFVIREEYLAWFTEFESEIPTILDNRLRIEKMTRENARQAIEGPSQLVNIEVEEDFSQTLLQKLSPNQNQVELTYLQVYLDKLYRMAQESVKEDGQLQFTKKLIDQSGNISDLLGSFLEEQIAQLVDPNAGLKVLKAFVSTKGTKRQINIQETQNYIKTLGADLPQEQISKLITQFVNLRILRDKDEADRFELRHDALAAKIFEKITLAEKELLEIRQFIEHAYDNYQKRDILLSQEDLDYVQPFISKLFLEQKFKDFLEESKKELVKAKRRRQTIMLSATLVLMAILVGFSWWAISERNQATKLQNEAEQKGIEFKAMYFNSFSKEILEEDPTKAFQVAEYAYSLDTTNMDVYQNLLDIYYENNLLENGFKIKTNLYRLKRSLTEPFFVELENNVLILRNIDNVIHRVQVDNSLIAFAAGKTGKKVFLLWYQNGGLSIEKLMILEDTVLRENYLNEIKLPDSLIQSIYHHNIRNDSYEFPHIYLTVFDDEERFIIKFFNSKVVTYSDNSYASRGIGTQSYFFDKTGLLLKKLNGSWEPTNIGLIVNMDYDSIFDISNDIKIKVDGLIKNYNFSSNLSVISKDDDLIIKNYATDVKLAQFKNEFDKYDRILLVHDSTRILVVQSYEKKNIGIYNFQGELISEIDYRNITNAFIYNNRLYLDFYKETKKIHLENIINKAILRTHYFNYFPNGLFYCKNDSCILRHNSHSYFIDTTSLEVKSTSFSKDGEFLVIKFGNRTFNVYQLKDTTFVKVNTIEYSSDYNTYVNPDKRLYISFRIIDLFDSDKEGKKTVDKIYAINFNNDTLGYIWEDISLVRANQFRFTSDYWYYGLPKLTRVYNYSFKKINEFTNPEYLIRGTLSRNDNIMYFSNYKGNFFYKQKSLKDSINLTEAVSINSSISGAKLKFNKDSSFIFNYNSNSYSQFDTNGIVYNRNKFLNTQGLELIDTKSYYIKDSVLYSTIHKPIYKFDKNNIDFDLTFRLDNNISSIEQILSKNNIQELIILFEYLINKTDDILVSEDLKKTYQRYILNLYDAIEESKANVSIDLLRKFHLFLLRNESILLNKIQQEKFDKYIRSSANKRVCIEKMRLDEFYVEFIHFYDDKNISDSAYFRWQNNYTYSYLSNFNKEFLISDMDYPFIERILKKLLALELNDKSQVFITSISKIESLNHIYNRYVPLVNILNDNSNQAFEKIRNISDQYFSENHTYKDCFIQDIEELENNGITHPDFQKVRELLGATEKKEVESETANTPQDE